MIPSGGSVQMMTTSSVTLGTPWKIRIHRLLKMCSGPSGDMCTMAMVMVSITVTVNDLSATF